MILQWASSRLSCLYLNDLFYAPGLCKPEGDMMVNIQAGGVGQGRLPTGEEQE